LRYVAEARNRSLAVAFGRLRFAKVASTHVLVELKVDEFHHEHIGQLNTYVTWYRKHMMTANDNPPVGILLCTEKDHPLVEYATASMDNRLLVSKYAVELPSTAKLVKSCSGSIGKSRGRRRLAGARVTERPLSLIHLTDWLN
jgi:hypothetical protein